jgi:diadenosine tetraphosphate (Ap4A) HIT family hydrolase
MTCEHAGLPLLTYHDGMSCELCDATFVGDLVFQNADASIVLHHDWAVRGHAMVIASRHVENVSDLDEDEWRRLSHVYRSAEHVLLAATGADRAIVMKLGIATPHLHIHVYPVSARLDRDAVMAIIDGRTPVHRDATFVESVREMLGSRLA